MSLTLLFSSLTHWLALHQECSRLPSQAPVLCAAPTVPGSWTKFKAPHTVLPNSYYKAGARAVLGIEPRTENHATRPNSQLIEDANDPKNSLHASDTAPHAAAERVAGLSCQKAYFYSTFTLNYLTTSPLPQECSELPISPSLLGLSVVQGILLLNLHPELLNNFTYSA